MTTVIKPESYFDDQCPIEYVPYFNTKTGGFEYGERLDTSRVLMDTFTFVSGALYNNPRNAKLQLQFSLLENQEIQKHLGCITTYAKKEKTRAFSRQLRKVYGTGKRDEIPIYQAHKMRVEQVVQRGVDSGVDPDIVDIQCGIPLSGTNKGNALTQSYLRDSFISIISFGGDVSKGCVVIVSIGGFCKEYVMKDADPTKGKARRGGSLPSLIFTDLRDDLFECEE